MTGSRASVVRERPLLLRWGLPRDPSASRHLAGFLVAAVVTVLLTRALLAASGYPQLGGDGLHIAHVLWGGLLMAVAFVLLLSFAGPVVRPAGALVGGVGFGLFVDEVGKFVTSDNDYFYEPTAALIYATVVGLVLVGEALHGRREHRPEERVAGAADHAVAGIVGGMTERARTEAHGLLERTDGVRGAREVRALLDAVEEDATELPNPIDRVAAWVVHGLRRLVSARWVPWVTVGVLVVTTALTVSRGLVAWFQGEDVPGWVVTALLVSAAVSATTALTGLAVVRRDRPRAYRLFRRAVLVSLLVTQVFVFRLEEWAATAGLVADLLVLGVVVAELSQMESDAQRAAGRRDQRRS
ncbi:hypothetical protein [Cellulomonas carbonis]|uniref:Uncharacterized protein n=1 Tax=Cellulomonas carbonis T26 TaxID=947969 RepID=A0A0A0BM96_9CELL|nr:hypothetical protein [Cellulomonas carbonis]KGM08802.1 hypothetical protein N868_06300 [Cellulomonas carbonis T26]GGB95058.1 hypothetical protein GCM10010972_04710 [Cellulomonas carbonis]